MRHSPLLLLIPVLLAGADECRAQATEHGLLAVYGDRSQGRTTASGEIHRAETATAAHATLPLGTVVRVANFDSGRMADVRVNDRKGNDGRMLTVSHAAARALGLSKGDAARGAYMVLSSPSRRTSAAPNRRTSSEATSAVRQRDSVSSSERVRAPAVPRQPVAGGYSSGRGQAPATAGAVAAATRSTTGRGGPFQDFTKGEGLFDKLFSGGEKNSARQATAAADARYTTGVATASAPRELAPMNAGGAVRNRAAIPPPEVPVRRAASTAPAASNRAASRASANAAPYRAQFGAFRSAGNAEELRDGLARAGIDTSIEQSPANGLFLVLTRGGFPTAAEAQRWIDHEAARRGWRERPVVVR